MKLDGDVEREQQWAKHTSLFIPSHLICKMTIVMIRLWFWKIQLFKWPKCSLVHLFPFPPVFTFISLEYDTSHRLSSSSRGNPYVYVLLPSFICSWIVLLFTKKWILHYCSINYKSVLASELIKKITKVSVVMILDYCVIFGKIGKTTFFDKKMNSFDTKVWK